MHAINMNNDHNGKYLLLYAHKSFRNLLFWSRYISTCWSCSTLSI